MKLHYSFPFLALVCVVMAVALWQSGPSDSIESIFQTARAREILADLVITLTQIASWL